MTDTGSARLPVLVVDGSAFEDLDGFAREFSRFLGSYRWNGNLDAFHDILRGGFGTPEDGFVLRWVQSEQSRERLGWEATVRWLEADLTRCHPDNRSAVRAQLERARRREGTTLFDWLVHIVQEHGPGGAEAEDGVHLVLEP